MKRTLFFSSPCHLSVKNENLTVQLKETGEIKNVAIEDVGFIILEDARITLSNALVALFSEHHIAVIFCSKRYLPASMLFHLDTHTVQNERFRTQLSASKALCKNVWKQLIRAKLKNQAQLLASLSREGHQRLTKEMDLVLSGDTTNRESVAARIYWPSLFGDSFTRARYGKPPNALLNYGYTILRAAMARSLAGTGLLPTIGVFHRNRYNDFPLADDVMEPFRPFVDGLVFEHYQNHPKKEDLTKEDKKSALSLLAADVFLDGKITSVLNSMSRTATSLHEIFAATATKLLLPSWVPRKKSKKEKAKKE